MELAAATGGFAAWSILGRGGFGPVYRGEWGGQAVAIKRLDRVCLPPPPPHAVAKAVATARSPHPLLPHAPLPRTRLHHIQPHLHLGIPQSCA